ncbi:MAG: MoxR family ATPase [Cellulomonadaceae bacterium]|nr:MoxR family ATPase [Cellulomonadaceae bacterium]
MRLSDNPRVDVSPLTQQELDGLVGIAARLCKAISSVVVAPPELTELTVATLLAGGHLLVEDVPGVGKTTLAKALARTIDAPVGRIQFTPDLLPSDVTGVSIFRPATGEFEFRQGPVFNTVVIGDEINRASPKTQSALLECMEEGQVTVDGTTYPLPQPFLVVATQNPVDLEGTYPLPEAQRDRFMARLEIGYPTPDNELAMLDRMEASNPLDALTPVCSGADVERLVAMVPHIYAADPIKRYVLDLVHATRQDPAVRLGASPRAALQLLRAAKAVAAMSGRDHVLPDDVQSVVTPVLAHRLILHAHERAAGVTDACIVAAIVAKTPIPSAKLV